MEVQKDQYPGFKNGAVKNKKPEDGYHPRKFGFAAILDNILEVIHIESGQTPKSELQ